MVFCLRFLSCFCFVIDGAVVFARAAVFVVSTPHIYNVNLRIMLFFAFPIVKLRCDKRTYITIYTKKKQPKSYRKSICFSILSCFHLVWFPISICSKCMYVNLERLNVLLDFYVRIVFFSFSLIHLYYMFECTSAERAFSSHYVECTFTDFSISLLRRSFHVFPLSSLLPFDMSGFFR